MALPVTDEDTVSVSTLVSELFLGLSYADVDAADLQGIAITATSGNGTLQYSTDHLIWTSIGTVSGNAALLLSGNTAIRYIPDGANGESPQLTFRAWDQTAGSPSTNTTRSTADTTTNGGTTAFSAGTAQAALTVNDVNDAPVNTLPDTPTVAENGSLAFSAANGNGTLAAVNAALDGLRFTPAAGYNGSASLQITTSDQGNTGTGGAKTYTDTVTIDVTAVNDAPVVTTSAGSTAFEEGLNTSSAPVAMLYGNISASYDAATGELTLLSSGQSATLAQWTAALRAVTYLNTSEIPSTSTRTLSFSVNDGLAVSNVATKTLSVASINDAPEFHDLDNAPVYTIGTTPVALDTDVTLIDPDLDFTDHQNGDYAGSTLTIARSGGPNGNDVFSVGGGFFVAGNKLYEPRALKSPVSRRIPAVSCRSPSRGRARFS